MAIWGDFKNRYWPAKWITDRQGRIRYFHAGEGNYAETENVIRTLLGVSRRRPGPTIPKRAQAGARRGHPEHHPGDVPRHRAGRRGPGRPAPPTPRPQLQLHEPALAGTWQAEPQLIRSVSPEASLSLEYLAREVNLVHGHRRPRRRPHRRDGRARREARPRGRTARPTRGSTPTAPPMSGSRPPTSTAWCSAPRVEQHTLRLTARTPGLEAFAYTFGA